MSQQELELPQGWVECKINDIADVLGGKRLPKGHSLTKQKTSFPYIRVTNFQNNTINQENLQFIDKKTHEVIKKYTISSNDLYISIAGSIGKVGVIPSNLNGANLTENSAKICNMEIEKKFLNYQLNAPLCQQQILKLITSTNQGKLALFRIKEINILMSSINEQKRIVSKIEELFSKIDHTEQSLEHTKLQLEQYRQSLLKFAFEGKLTEEWRQKHTGKIGSIDDFINLIKKANNEKNQDFLEIPREFLDKARDLPNEWSWISLANLGDLNRGKSKHRPRNDPILFGGKYPFIQTGVVKNSKGKITSFKQTYNEIGLAQSKLFPTNTICITIAANIADTSVLTFPACFPDSVVGYNGFSNLIENMFMFYYIQSVKSNLEAIAPSTAQKNINLDILQKMLVPIMSNEEQKEIIARIEQGFSLIENTTQIVESSLQKLQTMKMSILKQAFEGKLVPQDPNDEPASVLLARIKSTKESQSTKQRGMKNVK
ncbi:MAG: hypothetical protein HOL90_01480 [Candidatus Nitrosopelagicus sp.]|jgi:type I restriction enzyme, S subunit|nr:hypothetical protein [Candidatus Nitrosopelagicus sp.]